MGCFYVGFDYKNRINGYLKIGETGGKTPAQRFAVLRQSDSFMPLGYIQLIDESKAERVFVESYVRMKLDRLSSLISTQNDHFLYNIERNRKYEQAQEFADKAISYAIEACKMVNIKYTIGTKQYKRG